MEKKVNTCKIRHDIHIIFLYNVINFYTTQTLSLLLFLLLQPQLSDSHTVPGGGRPTTHSFRQYLWPGWTTTTKLIKTPSAKRSALMELHHNAFGMRMYYQHPPFHHLPLLTTHQYAFFIIQLQSRGMGLLYKMQNLTKMMHIEMYKHLCKWN